MSTTRALRTACMLLLTSQVTCDWVEIEQDHYKPQRKTIINSNFRDSHEEFQVDDTIKIDAADKKDDDDKKWSKGVVDRVANVANIRRVHTPSVKTTSIKLEKAADVFRKNVPDMNDADDTYKYRERTNSVHRHYFTERPNAVNVRYSQDNKGIKPIQEGLDRLKNAPNGFDKYNIGDTSIDNNKLNRNKIHQMETFNEYPLKKDKTNSVQNEYVEDDDDHFHIIRADRTKTSPRPNIFNTHGATLKINKNFNRKQSTFEQISHHYDQETFKYPNSSIKQPNTESRITKINMADENPTNFKILQSNPKVVQTETILLKKDDAAELHITGHSKPPEEAATEKNDKMDGMLKLMKVVSDIIYKNTHRSFKGKVKYLEGLKSTLTTTIEDHIDKLWPDDADRSRRVREARGHLELPSSESALMTISFLTFAVFLIKLVLQVINTYKNKTMMVTPTVVAAVGRVARALRSKQ